MKKIYCFWQETILLHFSNIIIQCFEHHKLTSIYLHCIGVAAEILEMVLET